jgi:hypothetical protein
MKLVKKFVLPVLFLSVLAVNIHAGELETPGYVPPPPSHYTTSTATTDETADASTVNAEAGENTELSDMLFYDGLMTLLSLY